jgi:hypothetical protein
MSREQRPISRASRRQVTHWQRDGFEPRQIDNPARVVDVDPHQGAVGVEIEYDPRRHLSRVHRRPIGEVDVERIRVRVVLDLNPA